MPGFVSHTIMARDVYNKLKDKNSNIDYLMTYSLGGDLSKYAKCRYDTHHKDMDKFIYDMADYIKDNKLTNNKEVMGVLYGHICHYMMDRDMHPIIRKISKNSIKNKHNHMLIEMYIDNYLTNFKRKDYLKEILIFKKNNEIDKMINDVYLKTYQTNGLARYYKFNLWLYKMLKRAYLIFSERFINMISGLKKYLKLNDITVYHNDINESYNTSINDAINYIIKINKYLKI